MTLIDDRAAAARRFDAQLHDKELVSADQPVAALAQYSVQGARRRDHMRAMKARNRGAH